jgi:hypothetical protein
VENIVLMVFAVVGVALASYFIPLIGLVAVAWGSIVWLHVPAAVVITMFYIRHGPSPFTFPVWPTRPA